MKSITYLIYIFVWEAIMIGGGVYLVFWRNANPWWMLLAVIMSGAAYAPERWNKL